MLVNRAMRLRMHTKNKFLTRKKAALTSILARSLITSLLVGPFATAADRPVIPAELTLKQALDIALANSTAIREAQAGLDQVTGRYEQSRSPRQPQINISMRQNL